MCARRNTGRAVRSNSSGESQLRWLIIEHTLGGADDLYPDVQVDSVTNCIEVEQSPLTLIGESEISNFLLRRRCVIKGLKLDAEREREMRRTFVSMSDRRRVTTHQKINVAALDYVINGYK